jgi:hypothetical protein
MKKKWLGITLLIVAIAATITVQKLGKTTNPTVSSTDVTILKGMIGSEKEAFFKDAELIRIARDKYHVRFDTNKAGSLEMTNPQILKDQDFVFPASQIVVEKIKNSITISGSEDIFRTPLVYYSWDKVVASLIKAGIAQKQNNGVNTIDTQQLLKLILADKKWSDIGLSDLFGQIVVDTSDPQKSNSGNSYAALIANILNEGNVVTQATLPKVEDSVIKIFQKSGFKKSSTSDLFDEYLKTGVGSHKIIVGYESDILHFAKQNPDIWKTLEATAGARILYPTPTLWSFHTLVAIKPQAKLMIELLKDPDVQKMAWEHYGFRTGVLGIQNNTANLPITGISANIDSVTTMPDAVTMDRLLAKFAGK